MDGPCLHNPLAVCAADSLNQSDIVPNLLYGFTPDKDVPSTQLALKFDENQKWYYFPGMTNDELIIFKQFQLMKSDTPETRYRGNFHSAFEDPTTPKGAQKR
jgi:hypothetical protein